MREVVMNFKPLFDRVVIEPNDNIEESKFGLVLPKTMENKPQIGVVVAVGDGENFDNVKTEMKVKIGDRVMFEKYAGNELKIEGKNYVVLRQIDIVGVFNDREDNC